MTTLTASSQLTDGCDAAMANAIDRLIRISTAVAVLAVASVAAYVSYWHAYAVVRTHGESGLTARLEPATIDGLVYASSMFSGPFHDCAGASAGFSTHLWCVSFLPRPAWLPHHDNLHRRRVDDDALPPIPKTPRLWCSCTRRGTGLPCLAWPAGCSGWGSRPL